MLGRDAASQSFAVAEQLMPPCWRRFEVLLPSHPHQGKCLVLVVEDEALVRLDAADTVRDAGFDVIEAADADDAIRILESRNDICVVFSDIDLPGSMDGLKLAAAVSRRWPPVRLILTSGHVRVTPAELPEGGRFFAKPYRNDDIARCIREMIPTA